MNVATDERNGALKDAKKARNLCLTWWKGHFCVGKVYASLNEHEKAINSFERAFALDPTKTEIQTARDDSRFILGQQMRKDHLDPRMKPTTIPEQLEEMKQMFDVNPAFIRGAHRLNETFDHSTADVAKGHQYENGDHDVKQDYEQAAKYFAKAASQGNAEGMYNLSRLTDCGLGVKKDHKRSLELFEQAAAQPPEHPLFEGDTNVGVAEAEHSLGLIYSEGISVQKNPAFAAHWYQRAVDHGCAPAANNLGLMYLDGTGVDKDVDRAEQLLQFSARRGDQNAMLTLAERYLLKNDFKMAKIMHERACRAENIEAKINRETFLRRLEVKQQCMSKYSLNNMNSTVSMESITNLLRHEKTPATCSNVTYALYYEILSEHANHGSITAKIMCRALEHLYQVVMILMTNEILTEEQENSFVHELAQCFRIEHIVAQFPGIEMNMRVDELVSRVLCRCSKQANSAPSKLDEDVRVCYATLNMNSYEKVVEFLGPCKTKYPKSIYFFELNGSMNGFLNRLQDALYDFNSGLEIEPNNVELLYRRAVILRQLNKDMDEAIAAYETFLSVAPNDHRQVPEAYYAICICCLQRDPSRNSMDLIKKFYMKGKEAEQMQLACFVPYKSASAACIQFIIDTEQSLCTTIIPVRNQKLRLTDPYRIEIIRRQRIWSNQQLQITNKPNTSWKPGTHKPRFNQRTSKSLVGLKSITIKEIDPRLDKIYHGYVLSATIIEDIRFWTPSIHLIIEDENLDCERLHIYGFPKGEGNYLTSEVYTVGSKIHLINPYLRLGTEDRKSYIRVNDLSSICMGEESERIQNMCRCCGQPDAPHVCRIFFSCYGVGAMSAGKHNVGQATVPPKGVKVGTASAIHFAMHAA